MKKNTIIAAIAAASAILLCASCQKQEMIEQNNGINAEGKVFTATINQGLTKSTITSDFKVNWEMGDEVSINEVKYTATPDANDPTKATLVPTGSKGAVALDGKYKALYPYSLLVPAEGQDPACFEFTATQTYEVGKFNAPMYAESTTDAFTFNNICGVLCLSLKGTDKVKSISVTANEAICGKFTMTDTTTVNLTGDGKTVTLDCGTEGVQLDATTATNFYIYLPPNTYTAGMKILATNTEDYIFEMTTTKEVKIEMNNIYTFDWNATFINPVPPTFKAVYDYSAHTLTFYYNSIVYEYPPYEVFEDSPTGYLFDDTKTGGAKWSYYSDSRRYNIYSVVIDASVKDYKGLTNTAYMFYGLESANNISGEEYLDVSNVTDMSYMFSAFGKQSSGLAEVPNVKDWNTGKVTNMSNMFSAYGKESSVLAEVPDVSKWDTGNVMDMSNMFSAYGYGKYPSSALTEVPDVKDWNTGKVTNMSNMFKDYGYFSALNKVPDVSKWNTGKVNDMSSMFNNYGYSSKDFNKVPDVSKWSTDSLTNMSSMFFSYGYSSTVLNEVPDVSLWETGNVTNMSSMFTWYGYSSPVLTKVPDVSLWESGKVNDMSKMFSWYGYSSPVLATVPDVSGWNSHKVTKIGEMFYNYGNSSNNIGCSLDLSGWDLSNITNGNSVFGFKAKTFDVTIPDKTGTKDNDGDNWCYGSDGTGGSITPPSGKHFTTSDIPAGSFNGKFSVSTTPEGSLLKGQPVCQERRR